MEIKWSKVSEEPSYIGYENEDFLKNLPTYYFTNKIIE